MSASTAWSASRLLWMWLIIAFTLASCAGRRWVRGCKRREWRDNSWQHGSPTYLRSLQGFRKGCQATASDSLSARNPAFPNVTIIPHSGGACGRNRAVSARLDRDWRLSYRPARTFPPSVSARGFAAMQLIAPDLFAEVSRLSVGACTIGLVLGLLVWFTGWWQHRFWVVAALTTGAGIYGLQQGRIAGVQPLVAGP